MALIRGQLLFPLTHNPCGVYLRAAIIRNVGFIRGNTVFVSVVEFLTVFLHSSLLIYYSVVNILYLLKELLHTSPALHVSEADNIIHYSMYIQYVHTCSNASTCTLVHTLAHVIKQV